MLRRHCDASFDVDVTRTAGNALREEFEGLRKSTHSLPCLGHFRPSSNRSISVATRDSLKAGSGNPFPHRYKTVFRRNIRIDIAVVKINADRLLTSNDHANIIPPFASISPLCSETYDRSNYGKAKKLADSQTYLDKKAQKAGNLECRVDIMILATGVTNRTTV
jgi:hypothetical protein